MEVYEIRLKLYMLQDVAARQIQTKVTALLDQGFVFNEELLRIHEANQYKNYVYNNPWPLESDKIYRAGKIYTLIIRTIDPNLAKYFHEVCPNQYTREIKALTAEIRILPKKIIGTLYSLTPIILKNYNKESRGYWRTHMSMQEFEERLKVNLIKKWNAFTNDKMDENFQLYTLIEFLNEAPIAVEYKNIRLLGDKIRIQVSDNVSAQRLAHFALGVGAGESNSRGFGFLNYRWL